MIDVNKIELTTPEKYMLIDKLADKLRWLRDYTEGDRAEHIKVATRLLELVNSLPYDGDAA